MSLSDKDDSLSVDPLAIAEARISHLEAALLTASNDLFKASNQFAGLMPDGVNWKRFEEKAIRAREALGDYCDGKVSIAADGGEEGWETNG